MRQFANENIHQGIIIIISAGTKKSSSPASWDKTSIRIRCIIRNRTYIFEKDGRIVGSCVLEIYSPKIAEIRSFVVHRDYRSQGVGKALIAEAVAEGRRRNIREIMVVTSAREYFEKQNFGACLNEKFALFWNGR